VSQGTTGKSVPSGFTFRSILIGLIVVLTVCLGAPLSIWMVGSTEITWSFFPIGVGLPFVLLVLGNAVIKKLRRSLALTPPELMTIVVMGLVASGIPIFMVGLLLAIPSKPYYGATPENGCLQVIPGISTGKTVFWKSEGFGIDDENLPGEPIDVPMKKGSVLFMHKLTPHGSGPNRTNNIRWSLDLRYQRTGTPTGRAVYPDFPVLSRSNPHSVLTDYEEWDRLWADAKKNNPTKAGRTNRLVGPTTVSVEDPFAAIAV